MRDMQNIKQQKISFFEHFPKEDKCPICRTNADKPCFLIYIDGTRKGNICEGQPVHKECVENSLNKFRINKKAKIIYLWVENEN